MSGAQDQPTDTKDARDLIRLARAAFAYSASTLFYQIVLRILPETIALPGDWNFTDLVVLGLNLSIWGGLIAVIAAILAVWAGSSRAIEEPYWLGLLSIILAIIGALLAAGTIPWLA